MKECHYNQLDYLDPSAWAAILLFKSAKCFYLNIESLVLLSTKRGLLILLRSVSNQLGEKNPKRREVLFWGVRTFTNTFITRNEGNSSMQIAKRYWHRNELSIPASIAVCKVQVEYFPRTKDKSYMDICFFVLWSKRYDCSTRTVHRFTLNWSCPELLPPHIPVQVEVSWMVFLPELVVGAAVVTLRGLCR